MWSDCDHDVDDGGGGDDGDDDDGDDGDGDDDDDDEDDEGNSPEVVPDVPSKHGHDTLTADAGLPQIF